jgi:hypothetical protein
MENFNAEQVKKGLEWAISKEFCENCLCTVYGKAMTSFLNEVLALINSQEQRIRELGEENERLRAESVAIPEGGIGNLSDGYHTFNELYHHRAILFSVICNGLPENSWKSKLHDTGDMYDGMFIVGSII